MNRNKHLQAIIDRAEQKTREGAPTKATDAAVAILNEFSPMFNALERLDSLLCACWVETMTMPRGEQRAKLELLVDRIDVDLDLAHENDTIHEIIKWDGSGGEALIKELSDAFEAPGNANPDRPRQ